MASVTEGRGPATARGRSRWLRRQRLAGWAMVAPCVLVLLGVSIFPLLYSLRVSFIQWDAQISGQSFVGLDNYKNLFQDSEFLYSLGFTVLIVALAVAVETVLGFGLALLLADRPRGHRVIVALLIVPVGVAPVVVGYTWRLMFDALYGPVNQFLSWITFRDVTFSWLNQVNTSILAIIVADVWQWTPFLFLVSLAGLAALPQEVFEAAAVDGAGAWRVLLHLTLPLIRPILVVAILIRAIDAMKFFDVIYAMTGGGPGTSTETVSFYLYRLGFEYFRLGYTAAATYILMILVSILAAVFVGRVSREAT